MVPPVYCSVYGERLPGPGMRAAGSIVAPPGGQPACLAPTRISHADPRRDLLCTSARNDISQCIVAHDDAMDLHPQGSAPARAPYRRELSGTTWAPAAPSCVKRDGDIHRIAHDERDASGRAAPPPSSPGKAGDARQDSRDRSALHRLAPGQHAVRRGFGCGRQHMHHRGIGGRHRVTHRASLTGNDHRHARYRPRRTPETGRVPPPRITSSSISSMMARRPVGPCGWPQTGEQP